MLSNECWHMWLSEPASLAPPSGLEEGSEDGCRIPLPWSDTAPPYGFSADPAAVTWLPQPDHWAEHSVEAQDRDSDSTLNLYRDALRLRPSLWRDGGDLKWLKAPTGVMAFERGGAQCWVNTGRENISLPQGATVVLSSGPSSDAQLPPDTTVWLQT